MADSTRSRALDMFMNQFHMRSIVVTFHATLMVLAASTLGCGGGDQQSSTSAELTATSPEENSREINSTNIGSTNHSQQETSQNQAANSEPPKPHQPPPEEPRLLADLVQGESGKKPFVPQRMRIDEARVAAQRIRKISGKHLLLYTDMPSADKIEQLPAIFDQAAPQWCEYFKVDPADVADWRMTGFLIKDKERFEAAGLLPDHLPPFEHGFQAGFELWVYDQPSDYYRRHLLLHEGTHAFMQLQLAGAGPPWYMEGLAELLGCHLWQDGKLTLGYTIRDRQEGEYWGRVKVIRDAFTAREALSIGEVIQFDARAHRRVEAYAWAWAAVAFFDGHPKYRDQFRALKGMVTLPQAEFNRRFLEQLQDDWLQINEQWQLLVTEMDYGYDVARAAVEYKDGDPLPPGGKSVTIAADRGWQSSGIRLEAGTTYHIEAKGRYVIGQDPKTWWCEPNGVTIHYHRGQPLGKLIASLRDDVQPLDGFTPLASANAIGVGGEFTPERSGTLYLRINESPAALGDNEGELTVHVASK